MPNLAQGANMAIEDGFVLARNLAANSSQPELGLSQYVAQRQPRTSRITLESRANFERTLKIPPEPPVDRSWIFGFDATVNKVDPPPVGSGHRVDRANVVAQGATARTTVAYE
jgi:2-polyprenyl-6-methoxyphenol hydroxylase-like FAD-dependent oxidoreductase